MIVHVRRGGPSAPRRRIGCFAALVFATACHGGPPKIVPPPPTASKLAALQQTINAAVAAPVVSRGTWGIAVRSLSSGDTLFALNARKLLMPASTLKVITLAVAADQLGWDYAYRTSLFTNGTVEHGVLHGDVIVVGSGDPTFDDWDGFASARFAEWAQTLKRDGIDTIDGRIIGDDNAFDDDGLGTGWAWDDLAASYATSVGALQFNQNTAQIVVTPATAGAPPHVEVVPRAAGLTIVNRATTADSGPVLTIRPILRTAAIEMNGSIGASAERIVRNVSVPNPTLYFADALRDGLLQNGIRVTGSAVDIDDLDVPLDRGSAVMRAEVFSKALDSIGATMMKLSQNLFAETFLKTLGVKNAGHGTTVAGRSVVDSTLTAWGIQRDDVREVDGSGLSRYNLLTPDALVGVLAHVYGDVRLRDRFVETLPRAGVDGTLGERMKGTAAAGNVRAKTGSFSNARAVAGYVQTADSEPVAFAILANNYGVEPALIDAATDTIIVALASFSRR